MDVSESQPPTSRPARRSRRNLGLLCALLWALLAWNVGRQAESWRSLFAPDRAEAQVPRRGRGEERRRRERPVSEGFHPVTVINRSFPPIENAPVMSAAEAARQLDDAELVLGVVVGDAARAYPINMLTGPQREIINDVLGGRAIAATW